VESQSILVICLVPAQATVEAPNLSSILPAILPWPAFQLAPQQVDLDDPCHKFRLRKKFNHVLAVERGFQPSDRLLTIKAQVHDL
jgi:hypothetical protein